MDLHHRSLHLRRRSSALLAQWREEVVRWLLRIHVRCRFGSQHTRDQRKPVHCKTLQGTFSRITLTVSGNLWSSQMDGTPSQPRPGIPSHWQCRRTRTRIFRALQECRQQQPAVSAMGLPRHCMLRLRARRRFLLCSVSYQIFQIGVSYLTVSAVSLRSQMPTSPPSPTSQPPRQATRTSPSATSTHSSGV